MSHRSSASDAGDAYVNVNVPVNVHDLDLWKVDAS